MLKSIKHRGPDGEGTWVFDGGVLGHVRLSIVDIEGGKQPMLNSDGETGITFNGEIYGFKELRNQYPYNYKSQSDTELILAMYEKLGTDLPKFLPGMFSFAIWDQKQQQLFCARDRFGEKPFYYAFGKNGEFIFGSEIKSILASSLIEAEVDKVSLAHYLKKGYINPQKTIYKNIHTLPPGCSLIFKDGITKVIRYWVPKTNFNKIDKQDAIENFRKLLSKAVDKQLVADVPISVFLSGGLDSSTIAAIAKERKEDILAISFEFEENSELKYAKELAEMHNIQLLNLGLGDAEFTDEILSLAKLMDEPFADSSLLPTYLLCKMARKHTKVALVGDGADELLGGYSFWYSTLQTIQSGREGKISSKDMFLTYMKGRLKNLEILGRNRNSARHNFFLFEKIKSQEGFFHIHNEQNFYLMDSDILKFVGVSSNYLPEDYWEETNSLADGLFLDTVNYLPGDILVKSDRASMLAGLETRSPFLDVDFAEFCLSLNINQKISENSNKVILRDAFGYLWPESIRKRSKQGFSIDLDKWMQNKHIQNVSESIGRLDLALDDLLDLEKVDTKKMSPNARWALLCLALWNKNRKS